MTKLDELIDLEIIEYNGEYLDPEKIITQNRLRKEIEEAIKLSEEINEGMEDIKQGRVVSDEAVRKMVNKGKQNEQLRKEIVDLADLWDGKESSKYGDILNTILTELGIKDMPEFYKKENIDEVIKAVDESIKNKKNTEIVERLRNHRDTCAERWCHCKIYEFDEILGEEKQ